jgi:hypothetical protein
MQLKELGKLKNPVTSSGIEPTAYSIVSEPTTLPRAPVNNTRNDPKKLHELFKCKGKFL